ncbi:MAG: hypothetical protein JW832_15170 [Deltaproteobacteria bacterium]|nr:hypothetical protein [Deltaproteobacteria bacterium]
MATLHTVHDQIISDLKSRLSLAPVTLKHPFPERPVRMLGLVKLDGDVFSTEKFLRIVCLRISLPLYVTVYSTFIRPRIAYDLPVLSCEVICMGSQRVFVLDIHGVGDNPHLDELLLERLLCIRASYPDLLAFQKNADGGIQSIQSEAACRMKIGQELDARALALVHEYLSAYCDLASAQAPLEAADLSAAQTEFDTYLKTVLDHDPGVKGNIMFFGRQGGIERALDIFYGI